MARFRSLFFGTPEFAVACLDTLAEISEVVGVVCQPDRPSGRGLIVAPPPIKERAGQLGIPVVQPTKLKTGEFGAWVRAQNVDVALVVAYGRILPADVLEAPRLGCVNVHASLLPAYRGAAPITWAVVHGNKETGVTLMKLDSGMDTGATFAKRATYIEPNETAGDLSLRLSLMGAALVRSHLDTYMDGTRTLTPQDDTRATYAPMLKKEHGRIPWGLGALGVHNHVRGMSPWPGAFTTFGTKTVKVLETRICDASPSPTARTGEVVLADKAHLVVAAAEGAVEVTRIQLEGRKAMRGVDWVMGRGIKEGDILGG